MKNNINADRLKEVSEYIFSDTMSMRNLKKATLVGIKFVDDQIICNKISENGDVYNLISEIPMFQNAVKNFDMISVLTAGWAAPVSDDDNDEIAPSQHKDRRRVVLALNGNSTTQYSTVMSFDDEKSEKIYMENEGQGSLKEEFINAMELIGW